MDDSYISKEEGSMGKGLVGQEDKLDELNVQETEKDDIIENDKRLTYGSGTGDSEDANETDAGCLRTEQLVYKNGVVLCSFVNTDRKCDQDIHLIEKDEVARKPGCHSLAEMAVSNNVPGCHSLVEMTVSDSVDGESNQRCLQEGNISKSQDGLYVNEMVDQTTNAEHTEINGSGQNCDVLGESSVGMQGKSDELYVNDMVGYTINAEINGSSQICDISGESSVRMHDSKNDISLLVPLPTGESMSAEVNVLKFTCSGNVRLVGKESPKQANDQQCGLEDNSINESPLLDPITTNEDAKNSSGHTLDTTESACNDGVCLGNVCLVDEESFKQESDHKDGIEDNGVNESTPLVPFNVNEDAQNSSGNMLNISESACNDSDYFIDKETLKHEKNQKDDIEATCNENVYPVDTESSFNDNVCPMDTESTCNDNVCPVDTESTCNENVCPVDIESTCNENVCPVDTESTCNENVCPVDTESACDNVCPADTESACNDNVCPVDTESACNDVCPADKEILKQKIDKKCDIVDNCINESLPLVPFTTNTNAKDSACGQLDVSEVISDDHVCDMRKETSKQESDQQDGITNKDYINEGPLLGPSETNENTKNFTCCKADISEATFNSSVCDAVKETSKQESDQENGIKTATCISKSLPLVHLDTCETAQSDETNTSKATCDETNTSEATCDETNTSKATCDETNTSRATCDESVYFVKNNTLKQESDQQVSKSDNRISSSLVPLDTDKITENFKRDEVNISKGTFSERGFPMDKDPLKKQEILNHKMHNDLRSSIFKSCDTEDGTSRKQDGMGAGNQKVLIDLIRVESCSTGIEVAIPESPLTVNKTGYSESLAEDRSEMLTTVSKTVHSESVEEIMPESQTTSSKTMWSETIEVDISEPHTTVSKTAHSGSLAKNIPEMLTTVHSKSVEVNKSELLIAASNTVHSKTIEVDIPASVMTAHSDSLMLGISEILTKVNKSVHSDSLGKDIPKSLRTSSKTLWSKTIEVDVQESLMTVSKTAHSESIGKDIPETLMTVNNKTAHSESIEKDIPESQKMVNKSAHSKDLEGDVHVTMKTVNIRARSESIEENIPESQKLVNKTAHSKDVEGDIHDSLKKSNRKTASKKKKRTKDKKGHRKKSKRKQESEQLAENVRFVEISRDKHSADRMRVGETEEEERHVGYNKLCGERMLEETYEEILDEEVETQSIGRLREPGEIEIIKERKKKAKKKKKKKKRKRRVATVEEGDVGDNGSHKFPRYLDGFFLQYDEGDGELNEAVGNTSVSYDHDTRILDSGDRIYRRQCSSESEISVKSVNYSDSVNYREEELENMRRKGHDKRGHKERKRKQKERSNSYEPWYEREHRNVTGCASREQTFDRERNRSERDEERLRSSDRKMRRIDREHGRDKEVVPDKDRRRVQVEEERRHPARSSPQDYRTVIVERSPEHTAQRGRRSESRGQANDKDQESEQGRAVHKDQHNKGRKSNKRDRSVNNSHAQSSHHRAERGSDKENNQGHKRRRQMRTQEGSDSDYRNRVRSDRRVQVRGASVSSSASINSAVRRRGGDSDDDLCIIISQENSDDDGASSDVILVESERVVINLDDDEEGPPSRVNITRGGINPGIAKAANDKRVRSLTKRPKRLSHNIHMCISPIRLEDARERSERQECDAAPIEDKRTAEVETLSNVTSESAYDPMHPTEEAEECDIRFPAFSSSRSSVSPVAQRPHSPDCPAPEEDSPPTPPPHLVTKARTLASPSSLYPLQPSVSSNLTSVPAFLIQTPLQSQQQSSLMPLSRHLVSDFEQAPHFTAGPVISSKSPNNLLPNCGQTPGFSCVQQSLLPTQDTVPFLPLPYSRLPVPFNTTMLPPFLPPPPPPPFGVCLEAGQLLPVPAVSQFSQLACTLPVMERHNTTAHRNEQDIFQPSEIFSSLHSKVSVQPSLPDKSPLLSNLAADMSSNWSQSAQPALIDKSPFLSSLPADLSSSWSQSAQPSLPDKSPLLSSLPADLSSSCSQSSQGHDGGYILETTNAVETDSSSVDDDYHLELLSPKANSKRRRQQRQHSNLNQSVSSGNSANPGPSSELSVKHAKTLSKDADKMAPKEHLQVSHVSQDRSKVNRGKKKRTEDNVREDEDDDVPASAADLTCKEKFMKKLYFQERVIEEVKMAIKPFYSSKKITKEQYKVILRKAVPKVCHNKKGNINPQRIQHLVEAYVRKMIKDQGAGGKGGKKQQKQTQQHRGVEKQNHRDKNISASVKQNGDRTVGSVR